MSKEDLIPINEREDHKELSAKGGHNKKGSKNLTTMLREMMDMTLEELGIVDKDDPRAKMKANTALLRTLAKKAISGENDRSITEVIDRLEGKPILTQRLEGDGIEAIKVLIVDPVAEQARKDEESKNAKG